MSLSLKEAQSKLTKHKLKVIGVGTLLVLGGLYYYYQKNETEQDTKSNSCCAPSNNIKSKEDSTKSVINQRYSNTAKNFNLQSKEEQEKLRAVAKVFGYSPEELEEIGNEANLGLGCGNPVCSQHRKYFICK